MKRMIRSNTMIDNWKKYYAEESVDRGIISEDEINDVLLIKYAPEFTEEDYDLFLDGITEYCRPSDIAEVEYANEEGETAGYDGGYKVTFKDGSTQTFGWYFGKSDLTEI